MKFSLTLDESLFDDELDNFFTKNIEVTDSTFDDDFSEYEDNHSLENVLPGPSEGPDTGVAQELIALINDEWEAIQGYNNAIANLRANSSANPFYQEAVNVLEEISAEENAHVGQLQEILKRISPNAAEIEKGKKEATNQLEFVGGVLPVQSWDDFRQQANSVVVADDETCTLSDADVDDDM